MGKANQQKTAIVLSGGGANGAYEVGVLKALMSGKSPTTNYEPLEPDVFCGTSIGSFNAAFLVSQWEQFGASAVSNLERFWLEHIAGDWRKNGIFKVRGNPFDYLAPSRLNNPVPRMKDFLRDLGVLTWDGVQRGVHFVADWDSSLEQRSVEMVNLSSFISTEPMRQLLENIDYQAIRQSDKWLKVAATNWATGELRMFWNHDMTDNFGPLAIQASAAVPGFFPPVEYGAQLLCDGGVLLNTPLSPAIRAGAQTLHVIYLDPEVKNIPLAHLRNTYDSMFRMNQISWASSYNDDIGDAARINLLLAAIGKIEQGASQPDVLEPAPELKHYTERYRPVTIYRYHPRDPLDGDLGFLNCRYERIKTLIARGFQDAVSHDFEESGDVFPVGEERTDSPREVYQ